ncbi:MAG: GntR family transcriptional regulator [Sphingomonas bacterium]|nr:GntR family transcriptional regulator [Sphingomonas bacterium]
MTSLTDMVFEKLKAGIGVGAMQPGDKLPTQEVISRDEGVSRTVVREAIARLVAQGLAESRRGSGVYVAEMSRFRAFQVTPDELSQFSDVINLLEIRLAVETEMAGVAAARRTQNDIEAMRAALRMMREVNDDAEAAAQADASFHLAIAHATQNPYYVRLIQFLGLRLVPPRSLYLGDQPATAYRTYAEKVDVEHDAILGAIVRMDVEKARSAARHHLQESLNRHSELSDAMRHAS